MKSAEKFLNCHILSDSGLEALETILYLIYKENPTIDYSPILINVVSYLLVYLPSGEAYAVTKKMIARSTTMLADED